jgi:acetyltransferase
MIIPGMLQAGYKGKIYPVNPNRDEICGLKSYESITSLPDVPELALLAVPGVRARETLRECVAAGVKTCIVIAAKIEYETADKKGEQAALVAQARQRGTRICGPNCEGAIYLSSGTWATFLRHSSPIRGEIALVTQSGGVAEFLLYNMWGRRVGLSGWVSSGNEIDLEVADYIEYFARDSQTKAISVFLEAARHGSSLIAAARRAFDEQKPLVILKVGRSEQARAAAFSHTGAIAGRYGVYTGLFRQFGIVRAKSLQDLVDLPLALAWAPLPAGNRVAVVVDSGGIGALIADALVQEGLCSSSFESKTQTSLAAILPAKEKAGNPLDITALVGPKEVAGILHSIGKTVLNDEGCDMLIVEMGNWSEAVLFDIIESLSKVVKQHEKPILPVFTAIPSAAYGNLLSRAAELKLPIYSTPEAAVSSARALYEYGEFRRNGISD